MATFVRLTNADSETQQEQPGFHPFVVNLEVVADMLSLGEEFTKITFSGGHSVSVRESIADIMKLAYPTETPTARSWRSSP